MKKIELGSYKDHVRVVFGYSLVDDKDFDLLKKYNWHVQYQGSKRGKKPRAVTTTVFIKKTNSRKMVSLHQLLIKTSKDFVIDHINGDIFDNRRANLRIATRSQNAINRKKPSGRNGKISTSKYKGVCYHKRDKVWQAAICENSKRINLGSFKTEKEAALAYNKAAKKFFKEFANLNVIPR